MRAIVVASIFLLRSAAFSQEAHPQPCEASNLDEEIRCLELNPGRGTNKLISYGPSAVDRILTEIRKPSTSEQMRGIFITSLRYLANAENRPLYRKLLQDPSGNMQRSAAQAICSTAGPADTDLLIEISHNYWGSSRLLAIAAMNRQWNSAFVPVLRKMLIHDGSPIVRAEIARTLAAHKVVEAIPDLEAAASDRDDEVRRAAVPALKALNH